MLGEKMNKKMLGLLLIAVSMLMVATLVHADEPPQVTVWTDKAEYAAGESGTLYIRFYNNLGSAMTLKKITIVYDAWQAYRNGQWEGNLTMDVNTAIISKGVFENETKFTVPTDGRSKSNCYVTLRCETDSLGTAYAYHTIYVAQTPRYMDQIITLFTIQVVLLIVCTIIIAATIFLSARRPQIMWKTEEKQ
jgi:hypothetical protein